jgi:RNA polymerase sigma factor (sigma-70 family)
MTFILSGKKIFSRSNPVYPFQVIVTMAVDGDEKAFKAIYDMLSGKMYSLCLRYAGNRNDADDLFQEGIIRVYKNLSGFKGTGPFEAWARRIFVNTCIDYLKNKQKLVFSELTDAIDVGSSELTGITKLTQADLLKIIQRLPNGYRTIVNLYLVEEYNHKEIAEMLGISEGTSKSQLSRARIILQKSILESYGRYQ